MPAGRPPSSRQGERVRGQRESLSPGTRLESFEIVRALGSGGFGTVYLAHDHPLDRDVAIKEYLPLQLAYRAEGLRVGVRSPELAASYAAGLRAFVNEARILARFDHPAVVKVHRFWEANDTAYMVMPWVQGPTLSEMRRQMRRPPTEAWLRGVIDPLLDALATLHAQGIYHRDIAPDNVLLPAERMPVLLDFGAARRVIGNRTQTWTSVLKPSFAPIEQYAQARRLRQGPWTDLYALGALCVYMLSAVPPPPAAARAVHDELDRLLLPAPAGVSASLLAAIRWALEVRPHDRPQSVQEFVAALDGLVEVPVRRSEPAIVATDLATHIASETHAGDSQTVALPDTATLPDARLPPPARAPSPAGPTFDPAQACAFVRAWEPTLRLDSPASPPAPGVPLIAAAQPSSSRGAWFASLAVLAVAAASAAIFLGRGPADPGAATWRALAEQAAVQAEARTATPLPVPVSDPPVPDKLVDEMQLALGQAAPVLRTLIRAPVAEAPAPPPAHRQPVASSSGDRGHAAAHKRKLGSALRAKSRPGPRELCAHRNIFRMAACIERRCESARLRQHPQCAELRRPPEFSWRQHEQD